MRRVPPSAQPAITGILLALAVTAVLAATPGSDRTSTTRVANLAGTSAGDSAKVTLVLSGDLGQYAGMCDALPVGGTDSLTGKLGRDGAGPVAPDDDVTYRGVLARRTKVTACGTKPAPTEDQVAMCTATLVGSARMHVELVISEGDRGAYIRMTADTTAPVIETVGGCPEPAQWLKDYYPNGASGIAIETVPSGLLQVGKSYTEDGVVLEVLR
jgi:hypothetical protein